MQGNHEGRVWQREPAGLPEPLRRGRSHPAGPHCRRDDRRVPDGRGRRRALERVLALPQSFRQTGACIQVSEVRIEIEWFVHCSGVVL